MFLSPTTFIAFLSGILPALLWLSFWLLEDRCQPEPKRYIFYAFVAGMFAVLPVLFIEQWTIPLVEPAFLTGAAASLPLLVAWAATEEIFKFGAAYVTGLRSWVFDEPLDAVIYMVTAALGFSGVENALFLYGALIHGDLLHTVLTGDLRFIGATLLHTLSSSTIGVALAMSFYKSAAMRRLYALCGVVLAIALHTLFNFFILGQGGNSTFVVFMFIWMGIVAILLLVEHVKEPAKDYC
jgi:RsiW-degrading membrane proteinase PrsW (M82 family)